MSSREFLSWTETAAAVIRITVHNEQWQHGKRIWKSSFEQMFFKLKVITANSMDDEWSLYHRLLDLIFDFQKLRFMLIYIADVKEVEFLYHFIFLVFVTTFLIFVCKPVSQSVYQRLCACLPVCTFLSVCLGFYQDDLVLSTELMNINWPP